MSPDLLGGSSKLFFDDEVLNKERFAEGMLASLLSLGPVMILFGDTIEKSGTFDSLLVCLFKDLSAINGLESKEGAIKL